MSDLKKTMKAVRDLNDQDKYDYDILSEVVMDAITEGIHKVMNEKFFGEWDFERGDVKLKPPIRVHGFQGGGRQKMRKATVVLKTPRGLEGFEITVKPDR